MEQANPFESHALSFRKLVGNLLSLELGARIAIAKRDPRLAALIQTQLPQVKEGDWVESNPLTNKDDLQQTLEKYNKRATDECKIDFMRIVRLRDALAHGRAFGFGSPQAAFPEAVEVRQKTRRAGQGAGDHGG